MRRILVLRGGALGDFIVTLPALALLRRRWPTATIELAGNATAARLAVETRVIDAAHSQHEARWSGLFSPGPVPAAFAAWLAEFDLVLSFWPDPEGTLASHFPRRTGQVFLRGAPQPEIAPAARHYCAPLQALGLRTEDFQSRLSLAPVAATASIALHPGSGSPRKNWPRGHWSALARWLARECNEKLLVVSGEAEPPGVLAEFGESAREFPLPALAARLAGCRLFVGHDSGVSHLAAACGVPCVLLFGPTDPTLWAPPAPGIRVVQRGPELSAISVADVQAAVRAARADRR